MGVFEGKITGGAETLSEGPRESQTSAGETMGSGESLGETTTVCVCVYVCMSLRERPCGVSTGGAEESWPVLGGGVCVWGGYNSTSTSNWRGAADLVGSHV